MKLTQLEQSAFIIETTAGFKLAVDIGSYTPLKGLDELKIDAVLVSHFHPDHLSEERIALMNPKTVYLSEECINKLENKEQFNEIVKISSEAPVRIGEIEVMIFNVDHGPNASVVPKENFGFLFSLEGQKIFFAGDMFYPSGIDVSELEVDKLLVPVGGFYTFGPEAAVEYAKKFKRVGEVWPMHYEIAPETKDEFLKLYKI